MQCRARQTQCMPGPDAWIPEGGRRLGAEHGHCDACMMLEVLAVWPAEANVLTRERRRDIYLMISRAATD